MSQEIGKVVFAGGTSMNITYIDEKRVREIVREEIKEAAAGTATPVEKKVSIRGKKVYFRGIDISELITNVSLSIDPGPMEMFLNVIPIQIKDISIDVD